MRQIKIEGLRELEAALSELPKATQRNVLKRVLTPAIEPVEQAAESNAPEETGKLERSIIIGQKLTRRQRSGGATRQADGSFRSASKNYVELHTGTSQPRGMFTEFGTYKDKAQMWFTRAWEATKFGSLETIKDRLWPEIERAATRLAKKRAKL